MNKRRNSGDGTDSSMLFRCALIVLPYLRPLQLAAASSTCKSLNQFCRAITSVRSSDATRNFENLPIPFVNASVDRRNPPYSYFIYTPCLVLSPPRFQPWGSVSPEHDASRLSGELVASSVGFGDKCDVNPGLDTSPAAPTRLSSDVSDGGSDSLRRNTLRVGPISPGVELGSGGGCDCFKCGDDCACLVFGSGLDMDCGVMGECGSSCECWVDCKKRIGQQGIVFQLKIVWDDRKGWGLCAAESIQAGQFVCEYAGELLTTEEARKRQQTYDKLSLSGRFSSALLVVREHLPSGKACLRINIDATRVGNVARFINHSCDGGNLSTVLVRSSGSLIPRVCFFASKDIKKDEELSFSYGTISLKKKGLKCFCGSSCCSGVLPSELT